MLDFLPGNTEAIAATVSAILTAFALFAGWRSSRKNELRTEDVFDWAAEAITALQTLLLITIHGDPPIPAAEAERLRVEVLVKTSALTERGRLFFRNAGPYSEGREKPRAYRGKRPEILDQLVAAHQVACRWPRASDEERVRMRLVAEDSLKQFVSLVQTEVGRSRTASADTRRRGTGAHLTARMEELDPDRVANAWAQGKRLG
ncbi:hypothetical protein OF829_14100 [Sphingomonas sp. LB-2]|uniref:hypothetical protein n=1 Tax=Sphingomonas caeni TaxID=2984949 RepID=UPI00222EA1D4|nr:hypothetical protein [Sphingomonas caeni]MCW3848372.1 hypothetical protein [Sphingomonas caeni]